jgi:hypothetical protein
MRSAGAALVALGLLVAGCGGAAPAPAGASTPPTADPAAPFRAAVPGIAAEGVRLRTDEAVGGQLQVRVTDTGTTPFTVTSVAIDSPGFQTLPATAVTADFAPGRTIDLPTPFGAVRCAAAPEPAVARLIVVRPDGAAEDLAVPLTGGMLARVHAEECAVEAVLDHVGIVVTGLTPTPDGAHLAGAVVLTRRAGDEPVEVTALTRNVLLEPVLDDELPARLAAEEDELRLLVTFGVVTCAAHVLAEVKQPFVFPLSVEVGGAEPVPVDLPLDDGHRAALRALVDRVCG